MTARGGSTIFGSSRRAVAGAGGWSVVGMDAVRRELRGSAIALVMVAVTTVVVYALTQSLEVRRGSVIYLLPVLLAGWHLGLIPALVAARARSGRDTFSFRRTPASTSRGRTKSSISCCSWWSPRSPATLRIR